VKGSFGMGDRTFKWFRNWTPALVWTLGWGQTPECCSPKFRLPWVVLQNLLLIPSVFCSLSSASSLLLLSSDLQNSSSEPEDVFTLLSQKADCTLLSQKTDWLGCAMRCLLYVFRVVRVVRQAIRVVRVIRQGSQGSPGSLVSPGSPAE